jgi:hypothetical protein
MLASDIALGQRATPDESLLTEDLRTRTFEADLKVCVTTEGVVEDVAVLTASDPTLTDDLSAAVKRWRYRPYVVDTRPVAFCHPARLEVRQAHISGSADVGEIQLGAKEGSGRRLVDLNDKRYKLELPKQFNKAGNVYWGLFRICISPQGEVTSVGVIASTGEHEIDEAWIAKMATWRYRPYMHKGAAARSCHPAKVQVRASE